MVADSLATVSSERIAFAFLIWLVFISTEPNTCLHSHALPDDETADLRFSSVDKIPILFWGAECGQQCVSICTFLGKGPGRAWLDS